MKKLSICLIGLALIALASFQASAWMNVGMVGGGVPAAAGCAQDTLTIGDADSSGATEYGIGSDYLHLSGYVAAESCTIDEIRIPITSSSARNIRVAVYSDSGGAPTGDDLGQSAAVTTSGAGAETLSLTISPAVSITASTRYWIAVWQSNAAGVIVYHNGDVANGSYYQAAAYSAAGDFPTISSPTDWDKQFVISGYAQ